MAAVRRDNRAGRKAFLLDSIIRNALVRFVQAFIYFVQGILEI